jgi:hypothetical protein
MPPSSHRQRRARRYGRVTVAAAVALSVAVAVPALLSQSGDPAMVSAAADTTGGLATSTTEAPAPTVDERDDLPRHEGQSTADETQTLRAAIAFANATPEERAALELFFTPPPAPEPAPQPAPAPAPVRTASAPAVSSGSVWDRLAYCEAHGDWTTHTASGFSGGLQFADGTWRAYGGTAYAPKAWQASREAQIAIAEKVLADAGWKAWPACSRKLGLR